MLGLGLGLGVGVRAALAEGERRLGILHHLDRQEEDARPVVADHRLRDACIRTGGAGRGGGACAPERARKRGEGGAGRGAKAVWEEG